MKDMKLIMESWRKFKEAKDDFPADGLKPVDSSVYDTHSGGAEPQLKGAPIKNRNAIAIYPPPGEMYDAQTGEINMELAQELFDFLDQNAVQVKHDKDPYTDDWLERTHEMFMDAIRGFQEKGSQDQLALDDTLDAKFKDAVEEIQAIIQARKSPEGPLYQDEEDTLSSSVPDMEFPRVDQPQEEEEEESLARRVAHLNQQRDTLPN